MRAGKLNRFLHQCTGQFSYSGAKFHKGSFPRPTLGTINVILAKLGNNGTLGTGVMFVGESYDLEAGLEIGRASCRERV